MLGALNLDSRDIGGARSSQTDNTKDEEKAGLKDVYSMVTPWRSVETVDIDEPVSEELIARLKRTPWTRFPVIRKRTDHIFGYLDLKDLVGIDPADDKIVRSLALGKTPIVSDDTPAYEVLNMLQRGSSKMAVVVPKSPESTVSSSFTPLPPFLPPIPMYHAA